MLGYSFSIYFTSIPGEMGGERVGNYLYLFFLRGRNLNPNNPNDIVTLTTLTDGNLGLLIPGMASKQRFYIKN
jgi:hypothetical protein